VRALIASCSAIAVAAGCSSTRPVPPARAEGAPRDRWTIAVASSLRALPEVQALVRARGDRFDVQVVEFDPAAGSADARLAALRAQLASTAPPAGAGEHLLVVGSPSTVPMGPWRFEGVDAPIATDWLLTGDCPVADGSVRQDDWQPRMRSAPRRTVGRIPFDDPRLVAAGAAATLERERASTGTTGLALLGAAGTGYAWPLASARRELRAAGWDAWLDGHGGSCDRPADAFDADWRTGDAPRRPALVVAAGPQYEPLDGSGQARGIRWILRTSPWNGRTAPGSGAASVLVAFSPGFARPTNPDLADLFGSGQVAAIAGFTGEVAASPLGPALETIRDFPRILADGMALGPAIERERSHYWRSASGDLVAWMPSAQQDRAVVALSAVLYGDPALLASRVPSGPADANRAAGARTEGASIVIAEDGAGEAGKDPEVDGTASPGSRSFALTTALFAVAIALLAAFVSRRKQG
jgi:hypothetical protein